MPRAIEWSVGADNTPFAAVMRNTEAVARRTVANVDRQLAGFQKGFGNVARWAAGATAAIGLTAAALKGVAGVKGAFDDGGALSDLSARTQIAVGELVVLRQAFATMTQGRPGPAHLDVPLDVFVERTDAEVPHPALWRRGFSAGPYSNTRNQSVPPVVSYGRSWADTRGQRATGGLAGSWAPWPVSISPSLRARRSPWSGRPAPASPR